MNNIIKIFFYVGSLSIGGAEKITIYLAELFKQNNIEVTIITNRSFKNEYTLDRTIKRVNLNKQNEKMSYIKTWKRLRSYIRMEKPDVLIVMGSSLINYAYPSVIGTRTKLIMAERNSPRNFSGKKLTQLLTKILYPYADGYVFQTEEASEFYNIKEEKKEIIHNPLFLEKLPIPFKDKKENTIVNIGRLHPQKNQKLLIDAFSLIAEKHEEHKLIIYGEGPERKNLETQIKELNLTERIFLPGSTPNVLEKIKKASIFAFSSDFEGMPNALIEAMSLGLPVVSTDCPSGGPRELIENGINGLLTPVKDKQKLADNLDYLLSNPNIAEGLGNEALKVRERLDADKIGKKWLDFSLKIVDEQ